MVLHGSDMILEWAILEHRVINGMELDGLHCLDDSTASDLFFSMIL